jgi:hypothetical protein
MLAYPAFSVAAVDMWWTSIIWTPMALWWPRSSVRWEKFCFNLPTFQQYCLTFTHTKKVSYPFYTYSFTDHSNPNNTILHHCTSNSLMVVQRSYVLQKNTFHAPISTIHSTHTGTRTPHVASHPTTQFPKSLTSISPNYSARHLPTRLRNQSDEYKDILQILNKFCLA